MIRSAAYRIAIISSAAFAVATIALGFIVYLAAHAAFVRQLDDRIRIDSASLATTFQSEGRAELVEAIQFREHDDPTNELAYALFAPDGRRIAGTLVAKLPPAGLHDIVFLDPREGPDPARALTVTLGDGTRLVVAADRDPLDQIDRTIVALFGMAFLAVILTGAIGAMILGAYLRRRLSGMSSAAEAIMAGDIHQRIPTGPRGDEFDRLALVLNAMLDRITGLLENLRQVSSDVAHDLRTPLARLRNGLEGGLLHDRPRDDRDIAIEQAITRSDEVLDLFAALLRISEVEAGDLQRAFAPLDLSVLAREAAECYAPAVEDGGRFLRCDIVEDVHIVGDRELILQAMVNLLDNAQIHTPIGTGIRLSLRKECARILLTVADDGPGVPEADRERITRRFIRLDTARTRPGHGLGLSLVEAIAAMHDARLILADRQPGLAVTIDLPGRP